jgi:hypothetical protein
LEIKVSNSRRSAVSPLVRVVVDIGGDVAFSGTAGRDEKGAGSSSATASSPYLKLGNKTAGR